MIPKYRIEDLVDLYNNFYNRNLSGDPTTDYYIKDLYVDNDGNINGSLYVDGDSSLQGKLFIGQSGRFNDSVSIANDLDVEGTVHSYGDIYSSLNIVSSNDVTAEQDLYSKNNIISDNDIVAVNDVRASGDIFTEGNVNAQVFVGLATFALMADLAEKYTLKEDLPVGTLVSVSTNPLYDVEETKKELCNKCVGAISDKPGFVLNSNSGGQPIALVGKAMVRVIGVVDKGDIIVPAGNGVGRALKDISEYPYKIGFSNENKNSKLESTIECIIRR